MSWRYHVAFFFLAYMCFKCGFVVFCFGFYKLLAPCNGHCKNRSFESVHACPQVSTAQTLLAHIHCQVANFQTDTVCVQLMEDVCRSVELRVWWDGLSQFGLNHKHTLKFFHVSVLFWQKNKQEEKENKGIKFNPLCCIFSLDCFLISNGRVFVFNQLENRKL